MLSSAIICCFKKPGSLDFTGEIYKIDFIKILLKLSFISGVKIILWGKNWGKMWATEYESLWCVTAKFRTLCEKNHAIIDLYNAERGEYLCRNTLDYFSLF